MNKKETAIMQAILEVFDQFNVLHVAGKSGSGKSLLVQLLGQHVVQTWNKEVILLDTMQKFSQSRFHACCPDPFVQNHFLVAQVRSIEHQEALIKKLHKFAKRGRLKDTGLLIIDSVSHYIREEISARDYKGYVEITNRFYERPLQDLLFLALHHQIKLIFVHEMTYKPNIGTIPFLHEFFEEIRGAWVSLNRIAYEKLEEGSAPQTIEEIDKYDRVIERYALHVPHYDRESLLEIQRIPYQITKSGFDFDL